MRTETRGMRVDMRDETGEGVGEGGREGKKVEQDKTPPPLSPSLLTTRNKHFREGSLRPRIRHCQLDDHVLYSYTWCHGSGESGEPRAHHV